MRMSPVSSFWIAIKPCLFQMNDSTVQVVSVLLSILLLCITTWLILNYYSEESVGSSYYVVLYISLFGSSSAPNT